MEFITISKRSSLGQRPRNKTYSFEEETYVLSPDDSFSITCSKFDFEDKFTNEVLLKSIKGKINNEEFNYDSLSVDLDIKYWLQTKENIKNINECSLAVQQPANEVGQKLIMKDSSIHFNDLLDDKYQINISKL